MPTLSLEQAAAVLHTTADTVSDCIRHRGLPAARIGRAYVLIEADVIAWLREQYPKEPGARWPQKRKNEA